KRLSNPGYVEKAPEKLVAQTREELESKRAELAATEASLERLG
ncbi:MAG: hypothetical protein KDA28_06180, partial [Phycisphaerales bacterium]|nr:hypothetical protein [Phycisphaerales bacterium]